jgi:1,4-alpha-glucan branching enzyme
MKHTLVKGAISIRKGYRFGVWAPHADKVFVVGTFNDWHKTRHLMKRSSDGIWMIEIPEAAPGDEYRYRIVHGDRDVSKIDPYARRVTHSAGNAIIRSPERNIQPIPFGSPSINELIIYELHIGTFANDSRKTGPGTLTDACERLPYLRDLGVNAIEIMPLAEFSGGYSWGYNPSHIFAVESDYGAPREFRKLVEKAHEQGLAVILDVVYNHFGPGDLDLWQFDGWSENGKGGIYFYNDWRSKTPWGDTRPDYGRKEVRDYIRDNAVMWFKDYNIDGLRWDMTAFIRNVYGHNNDPDNDLPDGWSLMQWINRDIKRMKSNPILVAEDLQDNPYLTKSTNENGTGFDTQWGASFVHAVRAALIEPDDAARDMETVKSAILHTYNSNVFQRIIYTESHDEVANGKARIPEEVAPGLTDSLIAKKKSALGAVMVFTCPGIPMIFQGQEFLEDRWFDDQYPLDWSKKDRLAGIHQLYKDLIALRLNRGGQTKGLTGQHVQILHLNQPENIIAWHRWESGGPKDNVVIAANYSSHNIDNYVIGMPSPGRWIIRFNSDSKKYDSAFGDVGETVVKANPVSEAEIPAQSPISIAAYSAIILSRDN